MENLVDETMRSQVTKRKLLILTPVDHIPGIIDRLSQCAKEMTYYPDALISDLSFDLYLTL